jgi:adenylate kinase family enzyme
MQLSAKIHITGAPGSGVTTLGRALAEHLNCPALDTDDFYWFTDDALPYRRKRNPQHRLRLLTEALNAIEGPFVVSGALLGWGASLVPRFDAIVYCWLPTALRLERIREREAMRYGRSRIEPGGDLHLVFEKFLTWAADYDAPDAERIRSKAHEQAWLGTVEVPVINLLEDQSTEQRMKLIEAFLRQQNIDK